MTKFEKYRSVYKDLFILFALAVLFFGLAFAMHLVDDKMFVLNSKWLNKPKCGIWIGGCIIVFAICTYLAFAKRGRSFGVSDIFSDGMSDFGSEEEAVDEQGDEGFAIDEEIEQIDELPVEEEPVAIEEEGEEEINV